MPSDHSFSVSCTSLTNACRCRTRLCMTSRNLDDLLSSKLASTASVRPSSVRSRMNLPPIICRASPTALSPILHGGVAIGEYVGGTLEVKGDDLTEVDGVVPGLHLAGHPALQVGEGLFEEWGA